MQFDEVVKFHYIEIACFFPCFPQNYDPISLAP